MPSFKDIAVVVGRGENTKKEHQAAAGTSDLAVSAWLAHEHMLSKARQSGAHELEGIEDGVVWLRWEGTLATALRELQLISNYSKDESVRDISTRRKVAEFLTRTGNAVCLHATNGMSSTKPTVWAVRTEFREVPLQEGTINLTAHLIHKRSPQRKPRKASSPAAATTPAAVTSSKPSHRVKDSTGKVTCTRCGDFFQRDRVVRHLVVSHDVNFTEFLFDAVRRHGPISGEKLAGFMSEFANGGAVTTTFVHQLLREHLYSSKSPLVNRADNHGRIMYAWDSGAVATSAVSTITPAVVITSSHSPAPQAPLAPEPVTQNVAATQPQPQKVTQVAQVPGTPQAPETPQVPETAQFNGSAATPPSRSSHFEAIADALNRAGTALNEAKSIAAAIVAENADLRGYRERVKKLLEAASE